MGVYISAFTASTRVFETYYADVLLLSVVCGTMQRNRMRPQFWPGYNRKQIFSRDSSLIYSLQDVRVMIFCLLFAADLLIRDLSSNLCLIRKYLPLDVPPLAEPRFPSTYRWRFRTPAPSRPLFQSSWVLHGPPRPYNYVFDSVSHQAANRTVRHPISSQSRSSPFRFAKYHTKNRRRYFKKWKPALNPSDPLNLQDLMKETDRRRIEGLSPPHGDSRLNTPALSITGELDGTSPYASDPQNSNVSKPSLKRNGKRSSLSYHGSGLCSRNSRRMRWQGRRMPLTGNYPDYYSRRDPDDRITFLMPEWFSNSDVADYGCHNGTVTFKILERFPDVNRIDAFDCDAELIENAKSLQREKIRWANQSCANFEKINFQVADWSDCTSTDDDPTYNIILAFSVTKWIHLNYGDAGLMRFFRRVFNLLKPGGHLLLEPQPKASYKNSRFTVRLGFPYYLCFLD